jgi:hypothetical protein
MVTVSGPVSKVCETCGGTFNLMFHHTSYEPEVLQVLCGSCHRKVHLKDKTIRRPANFLSKLVQPTGLMIRVDSDIIDDLKHFFPTLNEEGTATLVRLILKRTVAEAKRQTEAKKRRQESF